MTEYDFDEKNDLLGCGVRLEKSLSETAELTRQCSTNWRTRSYGRQSCIPIGRVQAVAEPNFGQSLALHSSWRFFVLSNYNFTSRFPSLANSHKRTMYDVATTVANTIDHSLFFSAYFVPQAPSSGSSEDMPHLCTPFSLRGTETRQLLSYIPKG